MRYEGVNILKTIILPWSYSLINALFWFTSLHIVLTLFLLGGGVNLAPPVVFYITQKVLV